jgi:hypothetical protein
MYYNAATDQWTCVVERVMDAEECWQTRVAAIRKQSDALQKESDLGRADVTRRSIAALVEGRVIQRVIEKTPALIGR